MKSGSFSHSISKRLGVKESDQLVSHKVIFHCNSVDMRVQAGLCRCSCVALCRGA